MSETEIIQERMKLVVFFNNEVEQESGNYLDTYEICTAYSDGVSDEKTVEAAHRIGGLWRVYVTSSEARAQLLCTGFNLRGMQITLRDRNLCLLPGQEHEETPVFMFVTAFVLRQ